VCDPLFTVVFSLEYMISEPLKKSSNQVVTVMIGSYIQAHKVTHSVPKCKIKANFVDRKQQEVFFIVNTVSAYVLYYQVLYWQVLY